MLPCCLFPYLCSSPLFVIQYPLVRFLYLYSLPLHIAPTPHAVPHTELDGSDSAEMPTHTSSSKAGGLLDPLPGPTDPIAQDSAGQDDWLDALFADPEKNDSPAPRRRMRAGVELDDDTSPASMRQRRDKSGPWGPAQDAGSPAPPGLPEGAPVEVTEGPWRGFTGSVLRGAGRQRVALQLDVFGKMTEAEVDVAHCRGLAE